ncbi:transcription factor ILR3 [Iris pallida]|uniref:Transcription factor ILR3 n=1 Tax=Iris pallida TaxID=29817 RepID=A0AAX6DHE0_IRIPA|nr:transcription factor ILR3 [Iris pallida]KAJ6842416.1 transcription factor ILR3 [Iris pallida]
MALPENSNWVFDCSLIVDDIGAGAGAGDFSAEGAGGLFWAPQGINCPSNASVENSVSLVDSAGFKESNSKKRVRAESCSVPGSKACREKMRRDRLNDRFLELGSILEPGKPLKMDKAAILNDAVRMVTQLRSEAEKLKDSNESLQEKIKELKAEKNELRDEKQRLKAEKENIELQIKMLNARASFVPHPPVMPTAFAAPQGKAARKLMMPVIGYPGYPMWQFMPPADVDTSQDAESCPPVA